MVAAATQRGRGVADGEGYTLVSPAQQISDFDRNSAGADGTHDGVRSAGEAADQDHGYDEAGYAQEHEPSPPGTFGTAEGYSEEDEYVNSSGLHVLTRHSPRHRSASTTLPKPHGDWTQWWKGDSGASVHATGRATHMYNRKTVRLR